MQHCLALFFLLVFQVVFSACGNLDSKPETIPQAVVTEDSGPRQYSKVIHFQEGLKAADTIEKLNQIEKDIVDFGLNDELQFKIHINRIRVIHLEMDDAADRLDLASLSEIGRNLSKYNFPSGLEASSSLYWSVRGLQERYESLRRDIIWRLFGKPRNLSKRIQESGDAIRRISEDPYLTDRERESELINAYAHHEMILSREFMGINTIKSYNDSEDLLMADPYLPESRKRAFLSLRLSERQKLLQEAYSFRSTEDHQNQRQKILDDTHLTTIERIFWLGQFDTAKEMWDKCGAS